MFAYGDVQRSTEIHACILQPVCILLEDHHRVSLPSKETLSSCPGKFQLFKSSDFLPRCCFRSTLPVMTIRLQQVSPFSSHTRTLYIVHRS